MSQAPGGSGSGLEGAQIPLGARFWRSTGRFGALVVGYVLLGVHVLVLALVTARLGSEPRPSFASGQSLARLALLSTVLLPLVSTCFLAIGELVRRGAWGGPSGHKPDALLPQGTNTVALRMIPVRWNAIWLFVSVAIAGVLLRLTAQDTAGSAFSGHLETVLAVNGVMAAGAAGASAGALVKKLAWLRGSAARERTPAVTHPAVARRKNASPATRFWRSFSFRWRFDIWLCALGAVAIWGGGVALLVREVVPDSDSAAAVLLPTGLVLLLGGLWATTQFWRSGEDLASGESLA